MAVPQINAYLVNANHILVPSRTKAPEGMPRLFKGSQPTDGARLPKPGGGYITTSNLILDEEEKRSAVARDSSIQKWLKPYVGGDELISGEHRWCLWLKDVQPGDIKASKELQERLARVTAGRQKSPTASVKEYAKLPWLFTQDRQPTSSYIAIPEVSSELREYIPIDFLPPSIIASNKLQIIPGGGKWLFALLTSAMHMAWMRTVAGRLKSDYSYSPTIYNSFPWPILTDKQKALMEKSANSILEARAAVPESTLEVLYSPDLMPEKLRIAHVSNDKLVDQLYRKGAFKSERERVEHLFELFGERNDKL